MNDLEMNIYSNPCHSYLDLVIKDNRLTLISEVRGGEDIGDLEVHHELSQEETKKLFDVLSLEEFVRFGSEKKAVRYILKFLEDNGIKYITKGF